MNFRYLTALIVILMTVNGFASVNSYHLNDNNSEVLVPVQQIGRTIININIGQLQYEEDINVGNNNIRISLPEEFDLSRGAILGPGNVVIPTITRKIAVPFDSDPILFVNRSNYIEFSDIQIAPADAEDLASYATPDQSFSQMIQSELVVGEIAGVMRDIRIYSITISPVQYDPLNNTMRVYDNIEIEIQHAGSQITQYDNQISEAFSPIYKSILDNPDTFDPILPTRGAYWYIFPDSYLDFIQPLVEWRNLKGFPVELIPSSEFGTYPTYVTVKNYISARFDTCLVKPDYIAIIGDVSMPGNIGIPTRNYSNPYGMGDIESDNFYTFLNSGTSDYFPEVLIGRISVDYATDLANYIDKFFSYERTPYMAETDWYQRATVVSGGDDGYFVSPRITKIWCGERMTDVGFTNIDTLFDSWSNPVSPNQVNVSINSGVGYVNYRGYGTASGWTSPYYTSSNISQLSNGPQYAIMTSVVCGTGDYDDYTDVCFGESWIRYANKGGPGFIGNSNHDAHTRWTNAIDCGIYWGWFVKDVPTITQAQLMGKMTLWDAFPNDRQPNGQVELYFNSYNVLGEPELNCWSTIPKDLNITHIDTLQFGQNFVSIDIADNSNQPAEGAYICLMKNGEIFAGDFVGENGIVNFEINPLTVGEISVTVTRKDNIPYEGVVTIINSEVAVGCLTHIIDDDMNGNSIGNNDGELNPSEVIELTIELKNFGTALTASNVTAEISSESPFVNITQNSASFGDIAPGASATSDQPYLFEVDESSYNQTTVNLILNISDNSGNNWAGIIQVDIAAAQLEVSDIIIIDGNDNLIDPGEIFEIELTLDNVGVSDIYGANAILRCSDDHVSIIDSVAVFGDCAPGGTFNNTGDSFMATVDYQVYVGHLINFTVEFTGTGPQVVTAAFSQQVGGVSSYDPIGPDDYGYYCFDNTDVENDDHPTYNWIDIETLSWDYVIVGDDEVDTIQLPFTVMYYGTPYDQITVCDNGWLAFGDTWWNAWYNAPIPAPQDASAMLALFWDDFVMSQMRIYYYYDNVNNWFVVGWNNVWDEDVYRYQTFEVIIYDQSAWPTLTGDNDFVFQYNDVNMPSSCSVGICSPDRQDGIGYLFNNDYADGAATLIDGRAIKFTTGSEYILDADEDIISPAEFSLSQSYPNPFNASAKIVFNIPTNENVKLDIYNMLGQKIITLVDDRLGAGSHSVVWNAGDISSGVYFYKLTAGDQTETKRMTLLK